VKRKYHIDNNFVL